MSDKYDDTDRHKTHLLVQVEDTVAKLRDSNRELEKTLTELRNTQLALAEAEKKRDEFKGRAQETVRQYVVLFSQNISQYGKIHLIGFDYFFTI